MKVFVTGTSGFIGSHVTRALLSKGHLVASLSSSAETPWRLQDIYQRIEKKPGKLNDVNSLRAALAEFKPDACIHLAWYTEPGKYLDAANENLECLLMSIHLFHELIQAGCRQIVAAGTCAEYAPSTAPLSEDFTAGPITPYAQSKLECLMKGRQFAEDKKINFAWGRIFYPYGPKEDERRLIPSAVHSLLKGQAFPATAGTQVRDYIHVEDVANAFCMMAEKKADGIYNVCSGDSVTIRSLLEKVGKQTGRSELIQFGAKHTYAWEPPILVGDNRRLKELGWNPAYSLEKGLEMTVQWFKANSRPASR